MPQNYSDAQGTVYDWRTGRPISGRGGVGSIPPSRIPPSGRPTSSRAPLGGVAPRRGAPSPQEQSRRITEAWGAVPGSANQQGFGYRMGHTPSYSDAQGRAYDAATGRPISGISEVGAIPPSPQTTASPGGGAHRPPAPPRPAPSSAPPRESTPAPSRSAPMPGFGTPQVQISAGRGRAARLNAAAQQAGANISYDSLANDAGIAARERSRMINEARAAGNEIPANLTPASENYYQQADIAAWGAKNPKLLQALRRRNGLPAVSVSDSFAVPPVAFGSTFAERLNRAGGYGMRADLAPGAAQAVPVQGPSFGRQGVTDRSAVAFDPSVDLRQQRSAAGYPMANVPIATAFDPRVVLMGRGTAPAGYSAANVPVQTAFDPNLNLSPGLGAAPQSQEQAAQDLVGGALDQIRRMSKSDLNFNPNRSYWGGSSVY